MSAVKSTVHMAVFWCVVLLMNTNMLVEHAAACIFHDKVAWYHNQKTSSWIHNAVKTSDLTKYIFSCTRKLKHGDKQQIIQ